MRFGYYLVAVMLCLAGLALVFGGCAAGDSIGLGGSTNDCLVSGSISVPASVGTNATKKPYWIKFSEDPAIAIDATNIKIPVLIGSFTGEGLVDDYQIRIPAGSWYVFAWIDMDTNRQFGSGDCGRSVGTDGWSDAPASPQLIITEDDKGTSKVLNIEMLLR